MQATLSRYCAGVAGTLGACFLVTACAAGDPQRPEVGSELTGIDLKTPVPEVGVVVPVARVLQGTVDSAPSQPPAIGPSVPLDPIPIDSTFADYTTPQLSVARGEIYSPPAEKGMTPPAKQRSGVGVNLAQVTYWGSNYPFINVLKMGAGWFTSCDQYDPGCKDFPTGGTFWNTREQDRLDLDSNGYVQSLPSASSQGARFRFVQALLFQGNGGSHPPGKYVVLYDGSGVLTYSGGAKKLMAESRPGRDVLEISNKPKGIGTWISIKSVVPGNHIRNIRVIPPGGICLTSSRAYVANEVNCPGGGFKGLEQLHREGEVFHPAFLADLGGVRALRFMDWMRTNTSIVKKWEQRPKVEHPFWGTELGVPAEIMVRLAKALESDMWFSLPVEADNEYVRGFSEVVAKESEGKGDVYLEYGNEPWNYAGVFGVKGQIHEDRGRGVWGVSAGTPFALRLNGYALRAAEVCLVFKSSSIATNRVKCILNGQAANPSTSKALLECPLAARELRKPCYQIFNALAVAPYFGAHLVSARTLPLIAEWLQLPDGGLDLGFAEITGQDKEGRTVQTPLRQAGLMTPPLGALADSKAMMVSAIALARGYGLPTVAYEGGQHISVPGNGTQAIVDYAIAVNRDPRMGSAYRQNMMDWKDAGGQLFVQFNHSEIWSRYGTWGMSESIFETNPSSKWEAVKQFNRSVSCWWPGC